MFDTDGIASMLIVFMAICLLAIVIAICSGITYGITYIWHEDLVDDTFEVVVLEKAMSNDDGVKYDVLVKGVDLFGNEYCKNVSVKADVYANISIGDTLFMHQKSHTQPIFGVQSSYSLVAPASANN